MTTITIYGPLRGKGRPRFAGGHAYTPETTRQYEGQIQGAWLLAHGERLDGPVALDVTGLSGFAQTGYQGRQNGSRARVYQAFGQAGY